VPRRQVDEGVDAPERASGAPRKGPAPRLLTDRQLEILVHVARGQTNRRIGEELGISERTVRNHMRTITKKLSTTDRTHAVVLAIGNGWIPVPIEPDRPSGEPAEVSRSRPSTSPSTS
jgi:DNA-binding NarL/FixJ family response regulator